MKRLIICLLFALLLTVPASAHPGDTDSSGGHYDHEAGEYHYHHGYEAHSHTDLDGDGDRDCPYDFDDQTGRNSGTPGSSSTTRTSASTTSTDYQRGYDDGHDDGYAEGKKYVTITSERRYEEGLEEGRSAGYSDGYAEGKAAATPDTSGTLGICAILCAAVAIAVYLACRRDREDAVAAAEAEAARQLRDMDRKLRDMTAERDALLSQQEAVRDECRSMIARTTEDCRKRIQENTDQCNARITQVEAAARQKIQNCFLGYFDPQRKSTLQFPKDIDFHRWGISRGIRTMERPFGDLTVFRTPSGKCFHTVRGCCGATDAACVYEELLRHASSCSKCTDYRYKYRIVPDWYKQYKLLLGGAFAPRDEKWPAPTKASKPVPWVPAEIALSDSIKINARDVPSYSRLPKWESVKDGMKYTRIFSPTIAPEDLEYAAICWNTDIMSALDILNEARKKDGLSPFVLGERR